MKSIAIVAAFAALVSAAPACTTAGFGGKGSAFFAQNYDWGVEDGLVVVNKRGMGKMGFTEKNPARWISKYGSVTFDQYGVDLPTGGMNEKGLSYGVMWLAESEYEPADARPALDVLQWAQHKLDTCSTVAEVREHLADVRIDGSAASAPVHYHFADAEGQSLVVEFIGGKPSWRTGDQLPSRVLTNDTYDSCAAAMAKYAPFGGTDTVPGGHGSVARFLRAAEQTKAMNEAPSVERAFSLLENVQQGDFTKWSIVYENSGARISFRTLSHPQVRTIDLSKLDFSAGTPLLLPMDTSDSGDVTAKLAPYSRDMNRNLIEGSFSKTEFLADFPKARLEMLIAAPEMFQPVGTAK